MILIRLNREQYCAEKDLQTFDPQKKPLRFLTEYIPDTRFIHHKRNHFIMTVVNAAFF